MIKTFAKSLLFLILLANVAVVPLAQANAHEEQPQEQAQDKQAPKKGKEPKDVECADLGNPDQTINLVITVLEETIGAPSSKATDTNVISCFRITKCTKEEGCKPKYGELDDGCSPVAYNEKTQEGTICDRVQAYIAKSGAGLLFAYIGTIYRWAAGTIGIVCVLFLVVGGVQITIAGDNQGIIDDAKQRIIQSIAGLVILLLSAIILYTVNPNFFTL